MTTLLFLLVFVDAVLWFGMFLSIWSQKKMRGGAIVAFFFAISHAVAVPTLYHLAFPTQ